MGCFAPALRSRQSDANPLCCLLPISNQAFLICSIFDVEEAVADFGRDQDVPHNSSLNQRRLQLVNLRKWIARHARRLHLLARLAPFVKPPGQHDPIDASNIVQHGGLAAISLLRPVETQTGQTVYQPLRDRAFEIAAVNIDIFFSPATRGDAYFHSSLICSR